MDKIIRPDLDKDLPPTKWRQFSIVKKKKKKLSFFIQFPVSRGTFAK